MATGGELLVSALRANGVEVVFGIPGTHNLEIYRHLGPDRLRVVTPRHEQGAGYAADGYARVTGRPGVVVTTSGPGLLNAAAAAGQAYSDSVPLLIVSPGMPLDHDRGSGLLHEVKDQSAALASVCARSRRVRTLPEMLRVVTGMFTDFALGRPRPVHLEIPCDLLAATADLTVPPAVRALPAAPSEEAVRAAAATLSEARRPALVAGGGARGAAAEVQALAELLGAPTVTTANGKGVLPEDHPLALGAGLHLPEVREFLLGADAVLAVGTELAETDTWDAPLRLRGPLIRVDLDPDQLHRPVAAHPLAGDAATVLAALRRAVGPRTAARPRHTGAARSAVTAYGGRWRPVVGALRAALPENAVLVNDSARVCYFGALTGFSVAGPGRFLYPTGFGTLGYALPAAIGAGVGAPGRPVAVLTGDGGLQFTVNELATAVETGLPLPVVVVNNGGYGMIRQEMAERGIPPVGVDLRGPDFPALSRAYGGAGTHATSPAELRDAVERALTVPGPTVIEVPEPPG
ncbi:5-guanidino-2-oxopentanoate decarboxylase [Streptomyces corynorhini]|uniref:5-guanidino-2-oxopentanoate decarboxylase n=1 Tax=Streptomyces corynorhini TaxID=2282652 RepID=A0A370BB81_9ACTN|nr:5-guanidino-2-oxopentanoate decarboxylase [Streptomyces corynorhini]RDG36685.1 5-guanidino-2-oxopentanoate decarboxylase [Streptomyces corynorhini]